MNAKSLKILPSAPVLAISLLASPALHAQSAVDDRWHYEASPYVWAAGIDGTNKIGGITTESANKDLFNGIDFGAAGTFEARRGRWGVLFDATYIELSDDASTSQGKVKLKLTQQLYSLGGAWRALEGPAPIDLIAGVRYNYLKPKIEGVTAGVERSYDSFDPYVGVRGLYPLSNQWSLVGYVDVGTYGGSDTAWQLIAGANYAIDANKSIKFGYRRLETKYSKNAFEADSTTQGLYLGMGFRF